MLVPAVNRLMAVRGTTCEGVCFGEEPGQNALLFFSVAGLEEHGGVAGLLEEHAAPAHLRHGAVGPGPAAAGRDGGQRSGGQRGHAEGRTRLSVCLFRGLHIDPLMGGEVMNER